MRKRRVRNQCLLGLALLALAAAPAWPQASNGSVSGNVRDQSDAVVPAAPVVLTNTDTNVTSRTTTNPSGFFVFPGVTPGPYRLEVEYPGMQKYSAGITVQTQQNLTVDPVLKMGQTTTTVEVHDVTPMVRVDSQTLGGVLERTRIENLPINGRNFFTLLQTVPGMEGTRAYGEREGSTTVSVDGATIDDRYRGGNQSRPPGLDTVLEFSVETIGSSAKTSRPATVVVSTQGGTNQIHGALFATNRNNAIGKARTRQDTGAKPPYMNQNEFGGKVSGPVFLPKLYDGRNRTFWLFSYEGSRLVTNSTAGYKVPTEEMWNGDFSNLRNSSGKLITLYDPLTTDPTTFKRQPFSYGGRLNVIDPKRMSPIFKYLSSITPRPTDPTVNPLVAANWWGPVGTRRRTWTTSTRIDHRFTDLDNFYVRLTAGDYWNYADSYSVPVSGGGANNILTTAPNKSIAVSWVRTISPTLNNELLLTVSRDYNRMDQAEQNTDFAAMLNLPNPFGVNAFPVINTPGFSSGSGRLQYQPPNWNAAALTYYTVDDNVMKVSGKHEMQFGFRTRWDFLNTTPDQQSTAGSVVSVPNYTALWDPKGTLGSPRVTTDTGYGFASMFLGMNRYLLRLNHGTFYGRAKEWGTYFQDRYRITPRLTLTLGMRWEMWPSYTEKYGNISGFNPSTKSIVLTNDLDHYYKIGSLFPGVVQRTMDLGIKYETAQQAGLPSTLMHGNFNNFGPRAAFAYRATSGDRPLVMRGGFGIYYYPIPLRPWTEYARSTTPFTSYLWWDPNDQAYSPDGYASWGLRNYTDVIGGVNTRNILDPNGDTSSITRGLVVNYLRPDMPDARSYQWNFTLEKEIMADTVVRASYIGKHTDNLEQFYTYNPQQSTYVWYATRGVDKPKGDLSTVAGRPFEDTVIGDIREYGKWGYSNYSGVEFVLEKRYSKGFQYQVFYNINNAFRAGGLGYDKMLYPAEYYLPGTVSADFDQRYRDMNYGRDDDIPKHRVRWNFHADLPFGKGKLLGGNASSLLDKFIGGWQLTGMGTLYSTYTSLDADWYPTGVPVQKYGYDYPIQDCRSGKCIDGYLWWNGYIPAHQINSHDKNGKPNGVMGVPDGYRPAVAPLNPHPVDYPTNTLGGWAGTNYVNVPMKDGSVTRQTYDLGFHPWQNILLSSTRQWAMQASLAKNIPIRERVKLQVKLDAFNVFNHPNNSSSANAESGIISTNTSSSPREIQLGMRLMW